MSFSNWNAFFLRLNYYVAGLLRDCGREYSRIMYRN
jgi:hypothetical protein